MHKPYNQMTPEEKIRHDKELQERYNKLFGEDFGPSLVAIIAIMAVFGGLVYIGQLLLDWMDAGIHGYADMGLWFKSLVALPVVLPCMIWYKKRVYSGAFGRGFRIFLIFIAVVLSLLLTMIFGTTAGASIILSWLLSLVTIGILKRLRKR